MPQPNVGRDVNDPGFTRESNFAGDPGFEMTDEQLKSIRRGGLPPQGENDMIFYGRDAIREVEKLEGELTPEMEFVIEEEGYASGEYADTKGISTSGVGQTGKFRNMSFKETFTAIEKDAKRLLPDYDSYPEYLRKAIMSAAYRGDLQGSPKFRKLMKAGKYNEAANEFLRNDEFLSDDTPAGIKARMMRVADAVRLYASQDKS